MPISMADKTAVDRRGGNPWSLRWVCLQERFRAAGEFRGIRSAMNS
jgi:hypothetical protein